MGLAALINAQDDMRVVGESDHGEAALVAFRKGSVDVLLLDLRLPGLSGVETILRLREEFPEARVIVLTTYDQDEDIFRAIQSGAKSYLLKDMPAEEISRAIRNVHAGEIEFPESIAERLAERTRRRDLTSRETEIVHLLVRGRSNKELAQALFISEDTVKAHLKTLFSKLGVRDRTEAAISAIRHGIVHLD